MRLFGEILDEAQDRLHDDGALWTRAELLRAAIDGYRELLTKTEAVRQWRTLDLPGRVAYAITHEWEDRHASGGTVRKLSRAALSASRQGTFLWEAEHLAGATPTAGTAGTCQEWERAFVSTDRSQRFAFPTPHERLLRLEWDGRALEPVSVRELDETDDEWWLHAGRPRWWTTGLGRIRTVELFQIVTDYHESYGYRSDDGLVGMARGFTGDRDWAVSVPAPTANLYAYTGGTAALPLAATDPLLAGLGVRITIETTVAGTFALFPWEVEQVDGDAVTTQTTGRPLGCFLWEFQEHGTVNGPVGIGAIRRVTSPDREYWPVLVDHAPEPFLGIVRVWGSSEDALLALEAVVPDVTLTEQDAPGLLPPQAAKFLRAYVLARAFDRPGEGHSSFLADLYRRQFDRGVVLLRRLLQVAREDQAFRREPATVETRRPPRVRFPSSFERLA